MKQGYTLIETVAVFLLMAVMVLSVAVSLVPMSEGFSQTVLNSDSAQKAMLACARITSEFMTITNIVSGNARSLTYDLLDPDGIGVRRTLSWSGSPGDFLLLDDVPLSDDVARFELHYAQTPESPPQPVWFSEARMIGFRMDTRQTTTIYSNRVAPRNLAAEGG